MTQTKTERRGFLARLARQLEDGTDQFMKGWKRQARRTDAVGDASHRSLELVHGGLEFAVRSLTRMERATQPPQRPAKPTPHVPEHHVAPEHHVPPAAHGGPRKRREPEPTAS